MEGGEGGFEGEFDVVVEIGEVGLGEEAAIYAQGDGGKISSNN